MNKKPVTLYLLGQFLSIVAAAVAMFWAVGRLDWQPAWLVLAIWLVWFLATDAVTFRLNPDLIAERLAPPKGTKTWDKAILSITRLVELARYIIAGLDQRYGWTGNFPSGAQMIAVAVCVLSTALFAWAMASNPFFSQVVRVQTERGHAVVTSGPYRFVRHPSYLSMILFELAISILLASRWAIFAGGVCAILLILRTALEDRTLRVELPGYKEYARGVRYRLLPGVWQS